jgi:tRNA-specific 2-thiouridylase
LEKSAVRKLARQYGLPVAEKKDSQGICFIGDVTMEEFLSHFISSEPGKVLNLKGEVIGTHRGATLYTIGERHGFEISKKSPEEGPYYIVSKDSSANTITVSNNRSEINSLAPTKIAVKSVNWITEPEGPRVRACIRYQGERVPATLSLIGRKLGVEFSEPLRGLSLGQSIVFYSSDEAGAKAGDKEICLGGGVMDRVVL